MQQYKEADHVEAVEPPEEVQEREDIPLSIHDTWSAYICDPWSLLFMLSYELSNTRWYTPQPQRNSEAR